MRSRPEVRGPGERSENGGYPVRTVVSETANPPGGTGHDERWRRMSSTVEAASVICVPGPNTALTPASFKNS